MVHTLKLKVEGINKAIFIKWVHDMNIEFIEIGGFFYYKSEDIKEIERLRQILKKEFDYKRLKE